MKTLVMRLRFCLIGLPQPLGQKRNDEGMRLADKRLDKRRFQPLKEDIAPMLLVPVPGRSDGLVHATQLLVAIRQQLEGKMQFTLFGHQTFVTEPKAKEYLALHAEGDVVVTERLVFCDAGKREAVRPYVIQVHHGAVSLGAGERYIPRRLGFVTGNGHPSRGSRKADSPSAA